MEILERVISDHDLYVGMVLLDPYPGNPRDWENLSEDIVYSRRSRYALGSLAVDMDDFELPAGAIALEVHAHADNSLFAGDPVAGRGPLFDDGPDGYIYASRQRVLDWFHAKRMTRRVRQKAEETLRQELASFSAYISGEVYMWAIFPVPVGADPETFRPDMADATDCVGGYYSFDDALHDLESDLRLQDSAKQAELDKVYAAEAADCM